MSGEPLLFIGPPGVAKTELVKAIGSALREHSKREHPSNPDKWFSYQIYDASKLNFEDLVGYPSIADLQKDPPEVKYVPTKSSIWGKDLIAFDEINRCSEDRQSNLFEIIRSRKLHGEPTGNTFIMSTMNPFGDQGTVEMSDALVDRHTFYLRLDTFDKMRSDDRKNVIKRVGDVDSVGLKYWSSKRSKFDTSDDQINDYLADIGKDIHKLMSLSQNSYEELKESLSEDVVKVVDNIVESLPSVFKKDNEETQRECRISGRRAASLFRAVLATRAVRLRINSTSSDPSGSKVPSFSTTFINTLNTCLPIGIGGNLDQSVLDRAQAFITSFVTDSWSSITSKGKGADIDYVSSALSCDSPIQLLYFILDNKINKNTRNTLLSKLLDRSLYSDPGVDSNSHDYTRDTKYNNMLLLLEAINEELPSFIPSHLSLPSVSPNVVQDFNERCLSFSVPDKYISSLKVLHETYKDKPIISRAIGCCMAQYKNILHNGSENPISFSTDEGVRAIVTISDFCSKLSALIEEHKLSQDDQDQNSKKEAAFDTF